MPDTTPLHTFPSNMAQSHPTITPLYSSLPAVPHHHPPTQISSKTLSQYSSSSDSRTLSHGNPRECYGTRNPQVEEKHFYSVWAVPPDDVAARLKKLMEGLRSEFGGPQFEPHITVVGAISLTPDDALSRFRSACDGLKAYTATVDRVATGTFFYQCVYVLIHPTTQVVETSAHCSGHFGYKSSTPYMPHLSLLYGDLTDDEKSRAQEKASILDESISSLSFPVSRLALYKTDTEDKTLKSWEKIAEYSLSPN
ncbi:cyclic phosphodiesterase-like [Juglans microcarpa x Juglans regia]|uniref:cyclic phosphodiesterase-like n=1 Tax=Juglans microcarpa x Juglans regia TaxID=2249226 RepID=UPI001B7E027E|nr:cyclic phosphodiesterase-like [Juglans microcarpa x Juglans regia]